MSYIDAIKKDDASYDIHDSRIGEEELIVKKHVISAPLTLETLPSSLISSFEVGDELIDDNECAYICTYKDSAECYFVYSSFNTITILLYERDSDESDWYYNDTTTKTVEQETFIYTGYAQGEDEDNDTGLVNIQFQFISAMKINLPTASEILSMLATSSNKECYGLITIINSQDTYSAHVGMYVNETRTSLGATYNSTSVSFNVNNVTHCRIVRYDCTNNDSKTLIDN